MRIAIASCLLLTSIFSCSKLCGDDGRSSQIALPRSAPESQGVATIGIRQFIEEADAKVDSMHSFMLVRNGYVISEAWWKPIPL